MLSLVYHQFLYPMIQLKGLLLCFVPFLVWSCLLLSIKRTWNLSVLAIILFTLNYFMIFRDSGCKIWRWATIVLEKASNVLSSAKVNIIAFLIMPNELFNQKLRSIGPTSNHWCIPEILFSKLLCLLFIQALCFRIFRYVKINAIGFKLNPNAASFAIKKSCRI